MKLSLSHIHTYIHTYTHAHSQPLFVTLAQQWNGYQDEVVLLSVLSNLLSSLAQFTGNGSKEVEGEGFQTLLAQAILLSDEQRMQVRTEKPVLLNLALHRATCTS